jgi:hypothetical protein
MDNREQAKAPKGIPLSQLTRMGYIRALCDAAEAARREAPTLDANPVPGVVDYATSGQAMELAMMHLRESIPNGQKTRTEAAMAAMMEAVQLHAKWLIAKGYEL